MNTLYTATATATGSGRGGQVQSSDDALVELRVELPGVEPGTAQVLADAAHPVVIA